MLLPGYDVRKAAQVAAYFALQSGGRINVLKLAKLLYLSEREYMARYDAPMFYDALSSLPDGPVTSVTLNLLNGEFDDERWSAFIAGREGYDIPARRGISLNDLDELSRADLKVLADLWGKFGRYGRYELRDWTHVKENVPEWVDPQGSSRPIHHKDVFEHLKKPDAAELAAEVEAHRALAKSLASG